MFSFLYRQQYYYLKLNYPIIFNLFFYFRSGYVILELADIQPGTYEIIPSTYLPGKEGPFILTVNASCSVSINQIR